eukprot:1280033-Amorphochlora_amoeboformis.AAC.1
MALNLVSCVRLSALRGGIKGLSGYRRVVFGGEKIIPNRWKVFDVQKRRFSVMNMIMYVQTTAPHMELFEISKQASKSAVPKINYQRALALSSLMLSLGEAQVQKSKEKFKEQLLTMLQLKRLRLKDLKE